MKYYDVNPENMLSSPCSGFTVTEIIFLESDKCAKICDNLDFQNNKFNNNKLLDTS